MDFRVNLTRTIYLRRVTDFRVKLFRVCNFNLECSDTNFGLNR